MAKKKDDRPTLTPEAADAFALAVHKWQTNLNLLDWRIHKSDKAAAKANCAEVNKMDLEARLATYRVGTDFGSIPITAQSIEEIACHEVLHVFLKELIEFCKSNTAADDITSAEHRVINVLVKLLVPEN